MTSNIAAAENPVPSAPARSLVRKLAEVKGAVDRIAKNGHNDHFNYDFATESDIAAAVRKEMADRRLVMFPNVTKTEWEKVPRKNGETKLCTLTVEFTIEDGDSGETRKFTILGQGEDSMDKATYKAMTGAEKYALLKLFMIPTGDDPEKDAEHRARPDRPSSAPAANTDKTEDDGSDVVGFGKNKGQHLSELDAKDLTFHLKVAKERVESGNKRFEAENKKWLQAVQAEASKRAFPESSGKKTAPPTTKSARTGKLSPEAQAVWDKVKALCRKYAITEESAAARIKELTGKGSRGELTEVDYGMLSGSLAAVPPQNGLELEPGVSR